MKQTKTNEMMKITTGKSILVLVLTAFFSISVFADGAIWTTKMGEIEYMKHTGTTAVFSNEKSGINPVTWFFINDIGQSLPNSGSYSGYWIDNSGRQMCEASLVDSFGTKSQNWGRFEITFEEDGSYPIWTGTLGDCFKQPDRVLKAAKPKDIGGTSPNSESGNQTNYLITANSVGNVRIGMTIAEAREAMSGAKFDDYESECLDFTGSTSISVDGKIVMTLDIDDDAQTIRTITVRDSRYRLANGVHPGTTIKEAEGIFGRIGTITLLYACFEEADFTNQPDGLRFFVSGGDYSDWKGGDPREKISTKYGSGAYIESISVSAPSGQLQGNANYLITASSAGEIHFGMTIAEARKILKGAKFTRDMDDGEGVIISADQDGKSLMWLYVDEGIELEDIETAPIVESGKIEGIKIFDSRYKTVEGVHCGMTVSDTEQRFGKLKNIWMEGLTGNEVATFSRHPKGFNFWIAPKVLIQNSETFQYNTAGIYAEKDPDNTARYETGAIISMIEIPARYDQ